MVCRIGIHLAEPEELRLSTTLAPGMRLRWALRKPAVRKRPKWTPERSALRYGWPRGSSWGMRSWRGTEEERPADTLPNDRENGVDRHPDLVILHGFVTQTAGAAKIESNSACQSPRNPKERAPRRWTRANVSHLGDNARP